MKKQNWIWIAGLGALGAALFFAYKKRNVPAPSEKEKAGDVEQSNMKKRNLPQSDMLFAGMCGSKEDKIYVKTTNLIPDVYGRYHNANGGDNLKTRNIYSACASSVQHTPSPTMLGGFK